MTPDKAVKELHVWCGEQVAQSGDPATDWRKVQSRLASVTDLAEVLRDSKMVRLFRARDAVASSLASLWLASGTYRGAAFAVKATLDRERIVAAERDSRGCILMTIHKSKGKEFDGVLLIEGHHESPFLDIAREPLPCDPSRRLLRVALTRARHVVTILRPYGAKPLVG